jgi:catalase
MYREVMSETDRKHLLTNIIGHAHHGSGLKPEVASRVGEYWLQVDPALGAMVAKALGNGGRPSGTRSSCTHLPGAAGTGQVPSRQLDSVAACLERKRRNRVES